MNEQPTHLDLFSGIGGFALAAGWAGFKTIGFCEIDPYCQAVLKKHWSQTQIHSDIRELRGGAYRNCTLLTGGFPCQPFSHAGKRRGKNDDRHLWPEMLRIIEEAKPTWIIGENVAGIINMELDQVCLDLEAKGYEVQPIVIPACAVDAPHRRDRIWIVGYTKLDGLTTAKASGGLFNESEESGGKIKERKFKGTNCASEDVAYTKCDAERSAHRGKERERERGWQEPSIGKGNQMGSNATNCCKNVANANSGRLEGANSEGWNSGNVERSSCIAGKEDVADTMRHGVKGLREQMGDIGEIMEGRQNPEIHGFSWFERDPADYESLSKSFLGRVANGIPNRSHRLKGLGNAIVPQVAYQIIKGIRELL